MAKSNPYNILRQKEELKPSLNRVLLQREHLHAHTHAHTRTDKHRHTNTDTNTHRHTHTHTDYTGRWETTKITTGSAWIEEDIDHSG